MSNKRALRILVVEDSEFDARIMVNVLRAGYETSFKRVDNAVPLRDALRDETWDVILADYNLPEFNALAALEVAQQSGLDIPFIIVSGGIGEDIAVAAMKAGAHDYVMKGNLARLVPAVDRELREAANRRERRAVEQAMAESELRYRQLWTSCPDAVLLADVSAKIIFCNPSVEGVFGYTPDELVGMRLDQLQPTDVAANAEMSLSARLADKDRSVWRAYQTMALRKDGRRIEIGTAFSEMMLHDEKRFVAFIRDVTERNQQERELRASQEQFRVAHEIQQSLYPKAAPHLAGFDIAGAAFAAENASGDYFDFIPMMNDRLGIVVGDVTGHGVGPALLMAETRAYLRILARNREDTAEILTRANRVLAEDVGSERFVTLLFARLDSAARTLAFANAGHPAGFVMGADGAVRARLRRTGVPLGLRPDTNYANGAEVKLAPGDLIVLLTDGLEEAVSPTEELFGTERILEFVRQRRAATSRELVDGLYQAARDFSGARPLGDDVTLIIAKVS